MDYSPLECLPARQIENIGFRKHPRRDHNQVKRLRLDLATIALVMHDVASLVPSVLHGQERGAESTESSELVLLDIAEKVAVHSGPSRVFFAACDERMIRHCVNIVRRLQTKPLVAA